jgi:hypothetical protein
MLSEITTWGLFLLLGIGLEGWLIRKALHEIRDEIQVVQGILTRP